MTTRAEKRAILETNRDAARRNLHFAAVAYNESGAGTKAQADVETAALEFAAAVRALRMFDEGRRF